MRCLYFTIEGHHFTSDFLQEAGCDLELLHTHLLVGSFQGGTMEQRYLIIDELVDHDHTSRMEGLGFTLLWPVELTKELVCWGGWADFNPRTTLLVLAGNGAARVGSFIPYEWLSRWQCLSVSAKRFWIPGESPVAVAGRIWQGLLLGVRDVVVLDDVISSGVTIRKIRQVNQPWIPQASWHAVCWLKQAAASTRGFRTAHATAVLGNRETKVPINSLSTLLEQSEIADSFARRKCNSCEEAEEFLQLLDRIRSVRP